MPQATKTSSAPAVTAKNNGSSPRSEANGTLHTNQKNPKNHSSDTWKSLGLSRDEILTDYRTAHQSRLASLLGRREVLTGKAKFGIFGDGKEVPQLAMARAFRDGDWRAGYYRDQTFMFAAGMYTVQEFFAQLYAHTSVEAEPASAGRMMNGHFATRSLNEDGSWKNLMTQKNSSADISPTGGQMPRLLGLAYASKLFRELPELKKFEEFSKNGDEVAFGTIGNASTSEGLFWEAFNAAGVLQVPMAISVWDDGYGISVPAEYQTCKQNISHILKGFKSDECGAGYEIYTVNGWDYPALMNAYREGVAKSRETHTPVLFHITELTQPQGHSTSGSHERYKSKERLEWEQQHDCVTRMREWIVKEGIATSEEMDALEAEDKKIVDEAKAAAWNAYLAPIKKHISEAVSLFEQIASQAISEQRSAISEEIQAIKSGLEALKEPLERDVMVAVAKVLRIASPLIADRRSLIALSEWKSRREEELRYAYSSHIYSEGPESALNVEAVAPTYNEDSPRVDARQVLQACFDAALARDPRVFAIGEDIGTIGDVNKAFEDLQAKHGKWRVTDTGIREATILGQGIGAAMRGLRPIVEIQYLDYLLYALETMSDDLATVRWRTMSGQKAPVIVRTRGHRLEGVWHSGSPMGMILNALRGMYVLVPRNMTQAAGFYNTMLKSDDPALIIEVLNGYRLKETIPANVADFTVPLGHPEVLREGTDVTLVTYGAMCKVALEAAEILASVRVAGADPGPHPISVEVIDVQSLIPFDLTGTILKSLQKTNRIVFADEDVPGGATAYMMQKVLVEAGGYRWLDSEPLTITGTEHRPAYGSDGDYFSKPNPESITEAITTLMHEVDPAKWGR
jgi:pyruvate/2-oxoglutarate/acetoin dehydrogenase E1 component/TPP-dependent pyruvate/acetoin dehydrogenase alpha subunit